MGMVRSQALDHALEVVFFKVHPLRDSAPNHGVQGILNELNLAAALPHLNDIPDFDHQRGDVHLLAVYEEMAVLDQLATNWRA